MTAGLALFLLDAFAIAAFWPLGTWLVLNGAPISLAILYALFQLGFLYALGLYRKESICGLDSTLRRIPMVAGLSVAASSLLAALLKVDISTALCIFAFGCFTSCAAAARACLAMLRRHSLLRPHLLVIGAGYRAFDLLQMLRAQGRHLNYDLTFVHESNFGAIDQRLAEDTECRIVTCSGNLLKLARQVGADEIVVAPDDRRGMTLESLITCRANGYPVSQYMSFLEKEISRIDIKRLDMAWMLYSDGFQISPIGRALKRIFDIVVSLVVLVPFAPVLLAGMLAVWLCDGQAVFYRQERVTQGGRSFRILKLRTMRLDAEKGGAVWAAQGDNRVTPVGRFLRRTRIDELPQLFNIVKGDMAFVGPRPFVPEQEEECAAEIPFYKERWLVKPGATGWAQINRGYNATMEDNREKLAYDLFYIKNVSLGLDLFIMFSTVKILLLGRGGR
jgi:sugar transferase (PEP-CTERM system associated)